MRLILSLVALMVFGLHSQAQNLPSFPSNQLEEIVVDTLLNGNPREYLLYTRIYDKGLSKLIEEKLSTKYILGRNGPEKVEFFLSGELFLIHEYDNYGRIISQERKNNVIPLIQYQYDDQKLIATEINGRLNGEIHSKTTCKFDHQMNMVAREEYKGENTLSRYWLYDYNTSGHLTKESYFDLSKAANSPSSETHYQLSYTAATELKEVRKVANQQVQRKTHFKYYPDSVIMNAISYESDGTPSEYEFELKHDSLRVVVNGFFEQGDTTKFRSRFQEIYLFGDLIEYESRTLSGTFVERFATFYEYDDMGNWIKKITYNNGVPLKEEIRKITY